ncbi:phage baseplate protein [Burkholderia plantarii]|uniref:phage baseplate protein n=1 Tax=Burkholderia plantarii TaxID=41899 RepID=UPI0008708EE6|nr:hypothetical protein [Burkholderia plantarii]
MNSISDILDVMLVGRKKIGSLTISAVITEAYTDDVTVTNLPVETNATISDHAYMNPRQIVMKCGWSNADTSALFGAAAVAFDTTGANSMVGGTYIDAVYSKLLQLQADHELLDIVTTRRKYSNMLVTSLSLETDNASGAALPISVTLQQVNVVNTKSTTLPPRANQARPAATAETQSMGTKSALPARPARGGSFTPS